MRLLKRMPPKEFTVLKKSLSNDLLKKVYRKDQNAKRNMTDPGGGIAADSWAETFCSFISEELNREIKLSIAQADLIFRLAYKVQNDRP